MNLDAKRTPKLDLVIIGGGPAGMSAALIAGRALLNTMIINAESPRNAVTTASHGFLTRDGAHPAELLAAGKEQLSTYDTVRYVRERAATVNRTDNGFRVVLADGSSVETVRLIIATGHVDHLDRLGLPGVEDAYGKSVYPCVFCDGFEHRGERLALFAREGAAQYGPVVRMWTDDLVVFTNGSTLTADDAEALSRNGVPVRTERIRRLESEEGILHTVELETGERIVRDAGFIGEEYSSPATSFAEALGVTSSPNEWGMTAPDVDSAGRSNVPGLYVIGDAKTGFGGLIASAAEGALCVETIVHEIATERWGTQALATYA